MPLQSSKLNPAFTPVDQNYMYVGNDKKLLNMIENYIYFYHTDTLIAIPVYPETIADSTSISYNPTSPLSSTAPTYSFQNSGPRSFDITLALHRELMSSINATKSSFISKIPDLTVKDENGVPSTNIDYVDILINQIRGAALPKYSAAEKMVNPPVIAVRFSNDIFCKGVVTNGVTVTYNAPILRDGRYADVKISFAMAEIVPFDAATAMRVGGFRGFDLSGKV